MKKISKLYMFFILLMTRLIGMVGCNSINNMNSEYDLDNFEKEMKSRGYEYKMQSLEDGIFTPTSQYMHLNDSVLVDGKQVIEKIVDI